MKSEIVEKSQTYWEQQMSEKILRYTRDELYMELRFLSSALSAFSYRPDGRLTTLATDGDVLFYSTEQTIRLFEKNPAYLSRVYLHSVLHCLFSHLWMRGSRTPYLWGIACDIAVEYTIDHMDKECTRRIIGLVRSQVYEELKSEGRAVSAAVVYRYLQGKSKEKIQAFYREFFADDHAFWPKEKELNERQIALKKKWQKVGKQTQTEQRRQGREEGDGEDLVSYQMKAAKSRRSYQDFLKKFMICREEMQIDPDEFDLGFYMYGLSIYRNLPLIEPLESRENKKIQDFVIVVDTSYSTSGSLIESFLKETFHLLTEENNFFRTCKVHLIQADEKVQSDTVLTGEGDIEKLFADFEVKGGGSTDFRPAFRYVDGLLSEGAFDNLCGLLYFTDGKGIYPKKRPEYKTAFLFLEDFEEEKVPSWAMRMQLEPDEIMNGGKTKP